MRRLKQQYKGFAKLKGLICVVAAFIMLTACHGKQPADDGADPVTALNKGGRYESERVGFAGSPSRQFKHYQQLLKDSTAHLAQVYLKTKGVAKVYVFKALVTKDINLARHLFSSDTDATRVHTMFGCVGGTATVKSLEAQLIGKK